MHKIFITFSVFLILFVSCKDGNNEYGYVRLSFEHYWDYQDNQENTPIQIDGTTQYINEAGNILTFDRLEYFISNLRISGSSTLNVQHPNIHYITNDTNYSVMLLTYQIPVGSYNEIRFTFGLDANNNKSNLFANSPEKDMDWPVNMGGGYHYMKIDGKWKNADDVTNTPFNLHLGALEEITRIDTIYGIRVTTQVRDSIIRIDTIIEKFHKHFFVSVPRSFTVESHTVTTVDPIIMDVKQWMERPFRWDFNVMGGAIMSRRYALDSLAQNGRTAFR
ncbi:MAG: hypothetical protein FWG79_04195 [Bacteroidales bacterium]|nr:hypothetical protein [Bacteroidales bacterium]